MNPAALFDIRGKLALVTGGSAGVGLMIAEGLLCAGAEVMIVSRKDASLTAAAEKLAPLGRVTTVAADLATAEGIATVTDAVDSARGLHILVNNAGATWGAPIDAFPRAGFEKILNINLLSPFDLTRALLPALRAAASNNDPARVINVASVDALQIPLWESYPYSASKAGLLQLSRHMGRFLAADDISVNCISPGCFPSRMTESVIDFASDEDLAHVASPLGGRVGTVEDIAGAVIFLSSRAGAWLSGINLPVAGGMGTIT